MTVTENDVVLHRLHVPGEPVRAWRIGNTTLTVTRADTTWTLSSIFDVFREPDARRWLRRHQLDEARFATRRDAVRTAVALLAGDPLPAYTLPKIRRTGPGRWQLTGQDTIIIRHAPGQYTARTAQDAVIIAWAPSLNEIRRALTADPVEIPA